MKSSLEILSEYVKNYFPNLIVYRNDNHKSLYVLLKDDNKAMYGLEFVVINQHKLFLISEMVKIYKCESTRYRRIIEVHVDSMYQLLNSWLSHGYPSDILNGEWLSNFVCNSWDPNYFKKIET